MAITMSELAEKCLVIKPCPFCGGEAEVKERTECIGHGDYLTACTVICKKCYASGPWKDDWDFPKQNLKPLAIEAWNGRVKEATYGQEEQ